jgi:hypothetical protein
MRFVLRHVGYGGEVHIFLTSALNGGEWLMPCSTYFIFSEKAPMPLA